ncbi:cobalt-precorrin-6A reductase [Actinophytocola glycyrrhizae]|uniref:Cobalt-precorrin-6A reductase n=1 Tax=Actinophytocola glycyrrhizae TaxID=2044873 RepID=A0ABV9SB99_9PSEU
MNRCVAILGGTGEARLLAGQLAGQRGTRVVSTLAGRVRRPRMPAGEVRVGGFGGPQGLADWLVAEKVTAVVDATHPFAERISAAAAKAAHYAGIPLVLLRRPGWRPGPGDDWHWADSITEAAAMLPGLGRRVFLTTGRQGLAAFARSDRWFLIRCVDPPGLPLPARKELILSRGPYTVDGERALMTGHDIDLLVTKDSGGDHTVAKLTVARELGVPVVVVRRPALPAVPVVATVEEALSWLGSAAG